MTPQSPLPDPLINGPLLVALGNGLEAQQFCKMPETVDDLGLPDDLAGAPSDEPEDAPPDIGGRLLLEATARTAEVEKFLDDVLISDIQETPLSNIDDVIDDRRSRDERMQRIESRAKELLQEEMLKATHERDVKELEEAVATVNAPNPGEAAASDPKASRSSKSTGGKRGSPTDLSSSSSSSMGGGSGDTVPPPAPFKLESANRKKSEQNPYVLNLTEFLPESDATRQARDLKAENDVLKACLANAKNPRAFDAYLKRSTHTVA